MTEQWTEKHRPETWNDIQGNNKAIEQIQTWAENWSPGDEAQLLVGDPGVGKTTTAWVAADELGYPLNQINASSARRTDDIKQVARSMQSSPVDSEHQLVLLDEVDNWHSAADKKPLYDTLADPRNPIILTANEKWEVPDGIKRKANVHEFKLSKPSRRAYLKMVAEVEGLDLDKQDLNKLASAPDLRSAINDMQDWSGSDLPPGLDERTWSGSPFGAIESLLRANSKEWRDVMGPDDNTFDDLGGAMHFADENLSAEWRGLEAGVGYDCLSRADIRLQQGFDSQARGFPYAGALLSLLTDTRLSEPYEGYINVDFPEWFKHSKSSFDEESGEAKLFRSLKRERGYRLAGSFYEFKQCYLPILQSLDSEEKFEIALNHGLGRDAIEAMGVSEDQYEEWVEVDEFEEGDGYQPDINSAADW